jgi:hypothetical protein
MSVIDCNICNKRHVWNDMCEFDEPADSAKRPTPVTTNTTESLDDMLDELAKLNEMGHPEYKGACYICGINPHHLKALIQQEVLRGRVRELENLPTKDSPRYGIANQPYVTKEWLTNRLAELNTLLGGESNDNL